MKFAILLSQIFAASITLASPIYPRRQCIQIEAVYTISSFTTRKSDSQTIDSVSFDIISADGGTLDIPCSAYDDALSHATEAFESGKVYSCGQDSSFSFAYTPNAGEDVDDLVLWQKISDSETWSGRTTPADAICRADENGGDDLICEAPGVTGVYVEMAQVGA